MLGRLILALSLLAASLAAPARTRGAAPPWDTERLIVKRAEIDACFIAKSYFHSGNAVSPEVINRLE